MNYWPRWISAIRKRTATLPLMQMGAYDRLLDHYYAEEVPLPADILECCRIAGAVTKPEQDAVRAVLAKFFALGEDGYRNERADEEIEVALPKIAAAQANGKLGGRPRGSKKKPAGLPVGIPPETRDEPTAKHPHPHTSLPTVKKVKRANAPPPESVSVETLVESGFDEATAAEFIAVKESRKAPLTARAWAAHQREAEKAGLTPVAAAEKVMEKTWKGFEAKYVADEARPAAQAAKSYHERTIEAKTATAAKWMGTAAPKRDFIDMETTDATRLTLG